MNLEEFNTATAGLSIDTQINLNKQGLEEHLKILATLPEQQRDTVMEAINTLRDWLVKCEDMAFLIVPVIQYEHTIKALTEMKLEKDCGSSN